LFNTFNTEKYLYLYIYQSIQNQWHITFPAVTDVASPYKANHRFAGAGNVGEGGVGMAKP